MDVRNRIVPVIPTERRNSVLRIYGLLTSSTEYIELVDWTGRQLHPGKRGKIAAGEPPALRKLGLDTEHWTMKVKGIGSGYWRAVGTVEELMQKAKGMGQHWLCGLGLARLIQR